MQANVAMSGFVSGNIAVSSGFKQGYVLTPTLSSLYLPAMLEVAFSEIQKDVFIQTRKEADLFNVAYLKSKRKTASMVARELLFADNSALVAHMPNGTRTLGDRFPIAARQFSL